MPRPDWSGSAYVRVYAQLGRDHPVVWRSPALLGWYVRLLTLADRLYPEPAELPRNITDDVVADLVDEGIIDLVEPDSYLFHGLDAERSDRARRGIPGGRRRAETATRVAGRFAGGATLVDAGDPIEDEPEDAGDQQPARDAGEDAGDVALLAGARDAGGRAGDYRAEPSLVTELEGSASARSTPAPAPAREAEPWHDDARHDAPTSIDCTDYKAHQLSHVYYEGVGWRCLECERARDPRSFRERVEAAGRVKTVTDDDRPF